MFNYPAEWTRQKSVWMAWPFHQEHWGERLHEIRKFYLELFQIITRFQSIDLIVSPEANPSELKHQLKRFDWPHPIHVHPIPHNDIWIRDYGPFYLKKGQMQKILLDFEFNAWGGKFPPWNLDNKVPLELSQKFGYHYQHFDMVLEGGSLENNGDGLLMTSEQCLLNPNRNPMMSPAHIESELLQAFHARKIIWLGEGLEGDHTDGHIDDFARFVTPDTIVLCHTDDVNDDNYRRMADNRRRLELFSENNPDTPVRVIPIPLPPRMDYGDERLPVSYANFIFLNGAVVLPAFGCPEDEVAKIAFRDIFPDREIVSINCKLLLQEGGGLHCMTKQEPL